MNIRNSNIRTKKLMFAEFVNGLKKQFMYGGKKYAPVNSAYQDKEATDYVCDVYPEFIESTIMKYLLRFKSQKREEDLFKIATYTFILWLKYFTGNVRKENLKYSKEQRKK